MGDRAMIDVRKVRAMTRALDRLERAFSVAKSFKQVKAVRDKAELARRKAQVDGLGLEVENRAAELKVRAERQLGQLLECLARHGGDRRSSRRVPASQTLAKLDVTHDQSSRWR